jgi:hypothetical protein
VNQTAVAQAGFVIQSAQAQSLIITQNAKKVGYQQLFQGLGLNTTGLGLSYIYVTNLLQSGSNVEFLVGPINNVIVNPS